MSEVNEQQTNVANDIGKENELEHKDFYCSKCYDMVSYFLNECETLSPKAKKFKKEYFKWKKYSRDIKNEYETLEFDYQEVKTQKEDLKERYKMLESLLNAKETSIKPILENQREHKYKREKIIQGNEIVKCNSISTTIHLDMKLLTNQFFRMSSTNPQVVFDYLRKTTNEINELKIVELKLKEELTNSLNSLEKVNQECSEFKSKIK